MNHERKKTISAKELAEQLSRDPEWVRRNKDAQYRITQQQHIIQQEEKPLIDDLSRLGLQVQTVWDLVNSNQPYSLAVATLADHLQRPYHEKIREGIARALTVKEARVPEIIEIVMNELEKRRCEPPNEAKWALANALTVIADASAAERLRSFLLDPKLEDVKHLLSKSIR